MPLKLNIIVIFYDNCPFCLDDLGTFSLLVCNTIIMKIEQTESVK